MFVNGCWGMCDKPLAPFCAPRLLADGELRYLRHISIAAAAMLFSTNHSPRRFLSDLWLLSVLDQLLAQHCRPESLRHALDHTLFGP